MRKTVKKTIVMMLMTMISVGLCFSEQIPGHLDYTNQWPDSVFPVKPFWGDVVRVTEFAYYLDFSNDGIERALKYSLVLEYDKENRLVGESYFNEDGTPANSISYEYENGNLAVKTQSHPDIINPDKEFFRITEDGRILEAEKIFSKGNYGWRYKNSYDSDGRIVLTSKYDRFWKWRLVYSRMFDYDEEGKLVSTEGFGMDHKLLWRDEHEYDGNGRVVESRKYNPDGDLVVRILNEYNIRGHVVRREFIDNTGKSYAVYSYGYIYDGKGNWTEKIIGRERPGYSTAYLNPDSVVIRNIEYSD